MVLSVSERTFNQEVLESPIPVLVDFGAPWCGLCRVIQPTLLQFQAHCDGQIKLVAVNADDNFKLTNSYRLKTLPTLLLIENGIVIQRLEGFHRRDELKVALDEIHLHYANSRKTPVRIAS